MPGRTESTGHTPHEIYTEQYSSAGQYQVFTSGTRAIFESGAAAEFESGSTLDIESGALLNIAGIARVPSGGEVELKAASTMNVESGGSVNVYGKLTGKSGGEIELEAGSTLNIEAGAAINFAAGGIERASIVTYTCSTMKLNIWDRYVIITSSDPHAGSSNSVWTLRHPQDAKKGILKTIYFESPKGDTHNLAIRTTSKKIGISGSTIHGIICGATNPRMRSTAGLGGISVTLMAATSSLWKIMTPLTTDKLLGKLQLTSSTEG